MEDILPTPVRQRLGELLAPFLSQYPRSTVSTRSKGSAAEDHDLAGPNGLERERVLRHMRRARRALDEFLSPYGCNLSYGPTKGGQNVNYWVFENEYFSGVTGPALTFNFENDGSIQIRSRVTEPKSIKCEDFNLNMAFEIFSELIAGAIAQGRPHLRRT